jgi:hypothetical protein
MIRRQPDRAAADDRDHVTGPHTAVQHPDLVAGGQDVSQHEDVLVGDPGWYGVGGGVRERHPDILGLRAVDLVAQDPPAAPEALARVTFAAEPAGPARGDAGDQDTVPGADRLDPGAHGLDGPYSLMTEDPAVGHRRNVSLEDVQVRAADRDGVDADDRVGVGDDLWLGHVFPGLLAGAVIDKRSHDHLPVYARARCADRPGLAPTVRPEKALRQGRRPCSVRLNVLPRG